MSTINRILSESISIREQLLKDKIFEQTLIELAALVVKCFNKGGKILLCGNGGSAADAQHIAAELSGRFMIDRKPLFAEALHVNSSYMTAVANDYGFEAVYERMVEAAGKNGDVLIGISTSGNSENVLRALKKASEIGMHTAALLGREKGKMGTIAHKCIHVPSNDTARIQEMHITIGHALCELVEGEMFRS